MVLNLSNGYSFNKRDSKERAMFFGANRVGKSQISGALEAYYDSKQEQYLLFDDNIMDRMILPDEKERGIIVFPKIEELNKLEIQKKQLGEKLKIKKLLKNQYGVDTQKAFKIVDGLDNCIKEDIYNIEKQVKKETYNKEIVTELINPAENKTMNIYEILDNIGDISNLTSQEQLDLMSRADIYKIQQGIIKENLSSCPVCYNDITDDRREQIKKAIESGSIDEQLKKSILYYLNSKNSKVRDIIGDFIVSPNKNEMKTQIITNVSNDIHYYLSKNIIVENIKQYNKCINSIIELKTSVSKFSLSDKTSADEGELEYVKAKLKEHSCCKNITSVQIVAGELKISGIDVEYKNMSTSEQNFFKFIYFDILARQKIKEGKLHIIVDDPFDSYDDAYINDIILIILKLIKTYENELNDIYIFSHSVYILKLYNEANNEQFQVKLDIKWLDVFLNDNIVYSFNDVYKIVEKLEINPSDYGIAFKVKEKFKDKYSFLMAASILKTELAMNKILFNNASADSITSKSPLTNEKAEEVSPLMPLINDLYDIVCDSVNHTRVDITITELSKKMNIVYGFGLIDDDNNIKKTMNEIDPSDYTKIQIENVTCSGSVAIVPVTDISHLFVWKYLLALKLRRELELLVRAELDNTVDFKELGNLIGKLGTTANDVLLKNFYEKNKELLNAFNHSSTRFIPPILVYRSKDIQECYIDLDGLKEKLSKKELQTI